MHKIKLEIFDIILRGDEGFELKEEMIRWVWLDLTDLALKLFNNQQLNRDII